MREHYRGCSRNFPGRAAKRRVGPALVVARTGRAGPGGRRAGPGRAGPGPAAACSQLYKLSPHGFNSFEPVISRPSSLASIRSPRCLVQPQQRTTPLSAQMTEVQVIDY
jgi:hypothetical protein